MKPTYAKSARSKSHCSYRSARRQPPPCSRARDAEELWKRIDGRLPRSQTVSDETRAIGEELWGRIDGSIRGERWPA